MATFHMYSPNSKKFFVPQVASEQLQAELYDGIRRFASESLGWKFKENRIYAIRYRHNGAQAMAQVGAPDIDGETILVILESEGGAFVVTTENRGAFRGDPILVGRNQVSDVELFE